jgi:raffinose/stachyose/melibiose transport system permease protein
MSAITSKPQRPARSTLNQDSYTILAIKYIVLAFVIFIILGPIVTAISGSIRTTGEFLAQPLGLPTQGIQWTNYTNILQDSDFWNSFGNSAVITIGITALNVTLASMMAFVFARVPFKGREIVFNILSIGLLFPLVVAILPIFIQIRQLGLINTMWGVILPMVAFGLPGSVVILRGFFKAIPAELEDAAYIDGCNRIQFFFYILAPIARPALAAVGTLQVIAVWNEYFLPVLILNDPKMWPLPLGIMQFQGQYGREWALIMAYVVILMLPTVVFYLFTERYIVTGLTGGELKG